MSEFTDKDKAVIWDSGFDACHASVMSILLRLATGESVASIKRDLEDTSKRPKNPYR